jgi:hypothetical protein
MNLFTLLNVLRPDLIRDVQSFQSMSEPNPFINKAVSSMRSPDENWSKNALMALNEAASTGWGKSILEKNPEFQDIKEKLICGNIDKFERVKMITATENFHSFAGIINRTRRRDIGNFTVRKPKTVKVDFSPEQQVLHDRLLEIQAEILGEIHERGIAFMMSTIRRQAASCIFGLRPQLEDILSRHLDELYWDEIDEDYFTPQENDVSGIKEQIQALIEYAKSISDFDPKYEELIKIIRDKQEADNNKIMLFSSFRHTLSYLYKKIKAAGFRVGLIHGGVDDDERMRLRGKFELPKEDKDALDILLFSEVGCEGLDYQFCDCMVNYDLPWNPMRIEQRIGRIDRTGQKSESVAIINMITTGTVDADIYERCLWRIGVFEESLGDCEEILGGITQGIKNIVEDFSLDAQARNEKLQQLSDNEIRLLQEQKKLEDVKAEFWGINLPKNQFAEDIKNASNPWLSTSAIQRLISQYLTKITGKEQETILGTKDNKTLRLSAESRSILLDDFKKLPKMQSKIDRNWERWLKGTDQYLEITFDAKYAMNNPKIDFITPIHPLVRQAANALKASNTSFVRLDVASNIVPPGVYLFCVYQWILAGVRDDQEIKVISSSEKVMENFEELLKWAQDANSDDFATITKNDWSMLDTTHYQLWKKEKENHIAKNIRIISYKRESLTTSHKARIALLNDRVKQDTNEKIRRMHQGEIDNAEANFARYIQDLDLAESKADIVFELVAKGVLKVRGVKNV